MKIKSRKNIYFFLFITPSNINYIQACFQLLVTINFHVNNNSTLLKIQIHIFPTRIQNRIQIHPPLPRNFPTFISSIISHLSPTILTFNLLAARLDPPL